MGRIDEAYRRLNLDVRRGTGAPASDGDGSPWQPDSLGGGDGRQAAMPAQPSQTAPAPALRWKQQGHEGSERRDRWARLDVEATRRLVVSDQAPPLLIEQYRSLAATLLAAPGERPPRSLIVTSASPGDGKSHVAVNLALTLARSYGRQVLLIDADLRRPVLNRMVGAPNHRGLTEALEAEADERLATVPIEEGLTLLPAGRPATNHLAGLASERMKRIVDEAAARFDWVIVDTPPVGILADGRLVADMVDGVLLVVRAGETPFPDLEAAVDVIGRERILGMVLNAVDPAEIRGREYYHRYYHGHEARKG